MTTAESTRWLIFRNPDGREAFGVIVEEKPASYVLDVGGTALELVKDRRQQREVKANSLDLLHMRDPEAIAGRFELNPVETIVAVLADRPVDRTKDQIMDQLKRFGIALDEKGWKGLQAKIAAHPNIERRSAAPIRYRWREAEITRETPEELLGRALAHSTPRDVAERARRELAALNAAFRLTPAQQALASLADVPGVVLPRWIDINLDGVEDRFVDMLLVRAAQSRSWEFITPVALDPGRPSHAAHAAQLLADAPPAHREEQLLVEIDRLATVPPAQLAEWGPRLALLEQAIGADASPAVVSRLLHLALGLGGDPDVADARRWAVVTAASSAGSRVPLVAALDQEQLDDEQREILQQVLVTERFDRDGPRLAWLGALARRDEATDATLAAPAWWSGVSLGDLPVLDADADLGPLVRETLGQQLLVSLAVDGSLTDDPGTLGQVLALPEWMLELVPVESLVVAADRLDPKSALGRAVEAIKLGS